MKLPYLLPLCTILFLTSADGQAPAQPKPASAPAGIATPIEPPLQWQDVTEWGVEGRAWENLPRERWFDRFPLEAHSKLPPKVWDLSRDCTGMMVRFKTDATKLWAQYRLRSEHLALPHMPATGASGLDLYARDPEGRWRWVTVTKPEQQNVKQLLIGDLTPGMHEFAAYLPLFNGIESLQIGVPPEAHFERLVPRTAKPIVFYGTSITHGACASRPGMVHTAILGRRLDRPVINLGFSGNGKMDASVGEYLALIDAAVYVIDCLPNMGPADVREKGPALIKALRASRPETPIVLVEDRRFSNVWIRAAKNQFHTENHAALQAVYSELQNAGIGHLFYLSGDGLLGDDNDGSTDGSHPNDLGYMRQADAFEPVLRQALGQAPKLAP